MMERKFVYNRNLNRTLQTRNVCPVRQLKKIVDNRPFMANQTKMITQLKSKTLTNNPPGCVKNVTEIDTINDKHKGEADTENALKAWGLNFDDKANLLDFIKCHCVRLNHPYLNILLRDNQWLGYTVKGKTVTIEHLGPFGEETGLAAQL